MYVFFFFSTMMYSVLQILTRAEGGNEEPTLIRKSTIITAAVMLKETPSPFWFGFSSQLWYGRLA